MKRILLIFGVIALVGLSLRKDFMDILHPENTTQRLDEIEKRLVAIETHAQTGSQLMADASYISNYVTGSGSQNTNSTDWVDMTSMSTSFTLNRDANILFYLTSYGYIVRPDSASVSANCSVRLLLDGATQIGSAIVLPGRESYDGISSDFSSAAVIAIYNITAGSHTVKGQFKTTNASYTATIALNNNQLGYVVLGK